MSESSPRDADSGSVVASDVTTPTISDASTNLPLLLISAFKDDQQRNKEKTLPTLPSHRFRYSVWHDLCSTEVKGSDLKAPRVRYGPPEKEKFFYKIRDDNNQRIHHSLKGRQRKDYRDKQEDWENTTMANLPYQELGHGYQKENFRRVLKRLFRVTDLNLYHNELVDFSSLHFPVCAKLNLSMNHLDSLKRLPRIPRIGHLVADDNYIRDLEGLKNLSQSPIASLSLLRNPVSFTLNYRQRVFQILPQLRMLDGVWKLPEDAIFEDDPYPHQAACVIS